jgi:hypothetical protein
MRTLVAVLALAASGLALAAEPLGMVIDVQGDAKVSEAGRSARLQMLSYLNAQSEIQLAPGAAITVTWYAGSKELRFAGPARLKVEAGGIQVLQGKAAQERSVADEKVQATKKPPQRLTQAAINMRSLPKLSKEQEARREKLRPADNAPLGEWVIYAMALEDMGLTGEARAVWKKLAAQRPEDANLRKLAGQ